MTGLRDRISQRYAVDLPVLACTVVESRAARIVDISLHGAKLESDHPYPAGQRLSIDLSGERIVATVTWTEVDRMGVKFQTPLENGHFRAALDDVERRQMLAQAFLARDVVRPTFGRRTA